MITKRISLAFTMAAAGLTIAAAPAKAETNAAAAVGSIDVSKVAAPASEEADAEFTELGQVIAHQRPGRDTPDEITLCDLTGTGIQDTAIATLAFSLCQQQQAGTRFTT